MDCWEPPDYEHLNKHDAASGAEGENHDTGPPKQRNIDYWPPTLAFGFCDDPLETRSRTDEEAASEDDEYGWGFPNELYEIEEMEFEGEPGDPGGWDCKQMWQLWEGPSNYPSLPVHGDSAPRSLSTQA